MDDALERIVDPTVLLPVVLLVVAEFGTLARDLDLREAVAEERPPLVVDFVVHGVLTYPIIISDVLVDVSSPVLAPWVSTARDLLDREVVSGRHDYVPERLSEDAEVVRTVLLPNLGQFGLLHLTNSGLVVFTFYATMTSAASVELSFVQYLLAFVVVMLPLLEVGEYDQVQSRVTPVYSFALHLGVNCSIVSLAAVRPELLVAVFGNRPFLSLSTYVVWWLAAGYLYLVLLALDIRRMELKGDDKEKQRK